MSKFDSRQHLGYLANKVGRLMAQELKPKIAEMGYNFPSVYLGVLADLWKRDGISQKELGMSIIKTKSSINKMLTALEKEGLVEKRRDKNDSRNKLIFLTQKGKDLRSIITEHSSKLESEFRKDIPEDELQTAKSVLHTLYVKLSEKRYKQKK